MGKIKRREGECRAWQEGGGGKRREEKGREGKLHEVVISDGRRGKDSIRGMRVLQEVDRRREEERILRWERR